ncbi:MAG: hypothetical protein WCR95_08740 [Eubacteriales bacterium]
MKKLLVLFVSLSLVFSLFALISFTAGAEDGDGEVSVIGVTFVSATENECKEVPRGGSDNSVLFDGVTFLDETLTTFDKAGIVLTQNTRCTEAEVYPQYSYILELSDDADITAVRVVTFEYYMAMIGLPKDNSIAVEYSSDGSDFIFAGDYVFEGEAVNGEIAANEYIIDLGKIVTGKYIRLTFTYGDSPFAEKPVWEWHGFTELGVEAEKTGQGIELSSEEPSDEPSSEPAETSVPAETSDPEESSQTPAPPTGDVGLVGLAALAGIALAGMVFAKRK